MLTIRFRWRVIFEPVCLLTGHLWQEYAVITSWSYPGKWCQRCHKSVIRHTNWIVNGNKLERDPEIEEPQPVLKVEWK